MFSFLRRIKAFKHVVIEDDNASFIPHKNVDFHMGKGSKIVIKRGTFSIGFPLPKTINYSSYNKTTIHKDLKWI